MKGLKEIPKQLKNKNGVYFILNKVNGKIYIGSTSDEKGFYKRIKNHLYKLKLQIHENFHLQNAWNKYGEDAFEFKIKIVCKKSLCLKIEQIYLNYYYGINSYNICKHAGSKLGSKLTEEQSKKFKLRFGTPISQYDLNGKLINKYLTLKDASNATGINMIAISKNINGKSKTSGGFIWARSVVKDISSLVFAAKNKFPSKVSSIFQYDKQGNFIKKWERVVLAERYYNTTSIHSAATNNWLAAGFQWKKTFQGDTISEYTTNHSNRSDLEPVYQYSLNGEFIKEWSCIQDAVKNGKFNYYTINRSCKGLPVPKSKFIWSKEKLYNYEKI